MLLGASKTNKPQNLIIFFLFIIAGWFLFFHSKQNICIGPNSFISFIIEKPLTLPPYGAKTLAILSLFIIFTLISRLNTKFLILSQRTYLPAFIYSIMAIGIAQYLFFHPILLVVILLIFAIEKILDTYRYDYLSYKVFDSALLLGIGILFYPLTIFFILFFFVTLIILRPFIWREWVLSLIGFTLPIYFYASILYLLDKPVLNIFFNTFKNVFDIQCNMLFSSIEKITIFYIIFILLIGSFYLITTMGSLKILVRKSFYIFFALFVNTLLIMIFVPSAGQELFYILIFPVTFLLSFYFLFPVTRLKHIFYDILIVTLLIAAIFRF